MKAEAWAVVYDGEINLKSISQTRHGAIVNWIESWGGRITESNGRINAEDLIETLWTRKRGSATVERVVVSDTQLAAAAPDLLEALQQMVAGMDHEICQSAVDVNFPFARAAIAKATGGAA